MADKIYMFDGGEIVESGSHDELMLQNGKYAEMYRVQAKKYRSAVWLVFKIRNCIVVKRERSYSKGVLCDKTIG